MYTFSNICRNSPASGARNALQSMIYSHTTLQVHCDYTYYTPEQRGNTFLAFYLIFSAKMSDLLLKYSKASSIAR